MNNDFTVNRENWSLHRKGYEDQYRHQEKIKETLKKQLPDLITDERIILSNGKKSINIPVRSLNEHKIRFNYDTQEHIGQGDGKSSVGDVVDRCDGSTSEASSGGKAGDQSVENGYEMDISLEELEETLFESFELPNLQEKMMKQHSTEQPDFTDIRKTGLIGNLDKKRTILSALQRNAQSGKADIFPIYEEDFRFKTWEDQPKDQSKAVIFAMMDTSGSMGKFEKHIARSFFFWMTRFLKRNYETVEIVYIAHHVEAKIVSENTFFHQSEGGGTRCSSAYTVALQQIQEKYPPTHYNIYPFHFTDGENIPSDNEKCIKLLDELLMYANLFGYGEINRHSRYSTLLHHYRKIEKPQFQSFLLTKPEQVYDALKAFFHPRSTI